MKEVLNMHIGQAGCQIGSSFWELLCTEHGIMENGGLYDVSVSDKSETYFSSNYNGKHVPRSIFVDLEPTVIDEIRKGSYRDLFNPDKLITGPEDAASNFARGFFTIGKFLLSRIHHEFRHLFESAHCVQGIMLFRSLGGGTGAGLTSAIFDGLTEYPKTPKIDIPIYPSPTLCSSCVEPYNSVLAEHFCMEDVDVGLLFDNEALFDICQRYLNVLHPSYSMINRIISQLCSSITASIRFENILNCDISVLQTNLVPYPRIHFPLCNFAPICSPQNISTTNITVSSITRAVFSRENQMLKVDPTYGRFMSCALFYRGAISPQEVHMALSEIKRDKNIDFVEWCPTGFKVGINSSCRTNIPDSQICSSPINVAMLTNSSSIGQAWQRITHKFYLLYSKRSFLHWFVSEGMEECEFTEALYNISTLVKDYHQVTSTNEAEQNDTSKSQSEPSKPPDSHSSRAEARSRSKLSNYSEPKDNFSKHSSHSKADTRPQSKISNNSELNDIETKNSSHSKQEIKYTSKDSETSEHKGSNFERRSTSKQSNGSEPREFLPKPSSLIKSSSKHSNGSEHKEISLRHSHSSEKKAPSFKYSNGSENRDNLNESEPNNFISKHSSQTDNQENMNKLDPAVIEMKPTQSDSCENYNADDSMEEPVPNPIPKVEDNESDNQNNFNTSHRQLSYFKTSKYPNFKRY